jgi:hypothetical protein
MDHDNKATTLKAEMAKKNLHTKRGLLFNNTTTTFEAFHSVPRMEETITNDFITPLSTKSTSSYLHQQRQHHRSKSLLLHDTSLLSRMGNQFNNSNALNTGYPTRSISPTSNIALTSSSTSLLSSTSNQHPYFLLYNTSSAMTPPSQNEESQFQSLVLNSTSSTPILPSSINLDQNPPCNTLYVGNLPTNTNQQELVGLFTNCIGYKRCSFRVKSNGPMCFVEFEDKTFAALALKDMQGVPLSNSVKGGIRLSYSKNPLVSTSANIRI